MKRIRSVWISVSLAFFTLGAFVLLYSVRTPSHLADAGVLLGGIICGLAVFSAYMALEQHRQLRALERHLHPHHDHHSS